MHKTPTRRTVAYKRTTHNGKTGTADVNKIKAFLMQTGKGIRKSAHTSWDGIRARGLKTNRYLGKRPMRTVGVSLATGLVAGIVLSYMVVNNTRKKFLSFLRK